MEPSFYDIINKIKERIKMSETIKKTRKTRKQENKEIHTSHLYLKK